MKKHDEFTVDIEENVSMSRSLAHYEGKRVIISGGWAGEKARVSVKKQKDSRIDAILLEVLEKAPYETEGICADFGRCGGCSAGGITYEKQLELKEAYVRGLFDKAAIPYDEFEPIVASPVTQGYRNKMEFSFGDEVKGGPLTLGMHEKGRHYSIVSVRHCSISPADFNMINAAVEEYFRKQGTPFYRQMDRTGVLRHLVLRHSVQDNAIMVNLVTTSREDIDREGFVSMLLSLKLEGTITGILHTCNDAFADAVISQKTELWYGEDYLTERICGLDFRLSPFSFFQTNSRGAEKLYEKVREYCGDCSERTIFDLYCGTGTIAQIVSRGAKAVYGIELVEEAVEAARINAALNGIDNCSFIAGDVLSKVDELSGKADIIILDPPRAGINPKAAPKIIAFAPECFIYVSCKAQSLINDLPAFLEAGYRVKKVCPVDMFPHTEHVETVVLLSRKQGQGAEDGLK
ncbi:MAG: 23S rRNA (uracil(1939)-C(5))-methyltransferase RlmD [Eubacteriaceae bacterium]|nr:23S rRNA (uracil(1939)-C(5))-methyltransferase RlmD [Eubacteriaceae bacterium]